MEINIVNIPKALIYFILGVVVNIVFYYILSPNEADLIGILTNVGDGFGFSMGASTTGMIWIGIMAVSIFLNIAYPMMLIIQKDEGE